MANYNIYFSPTGGTKKVADILSNHLLRNFTNIDLCQSIASLSLSEDDVCIVSVPSFGGRVPAIAIERLQQIAGNGAQAVLNCVYGNREWEDTLTELQDTMETLGFRCIAAIAAVAEHSIFRQFATGRPDADDESQLAEFSRQIQVKLHTHEITGLQLPGNHGTYKIFNGTPLQPTANENCTGCGRCAKECPVGAIDANHPLAPDAEKCMSCMRCIRICPQQARSCDADLMALLTEKLTPVLNGHKENHLFL